MIGRNQLVRFVGQDRENDTLVIFILSLLLPNGRQHQRPAVFAAEIIGLLAPLLPPLIKPLRRNDAALFLQVGAKLPSAHSVRARVEQRRAGLAAGPVM